MNNLTGWPQKWTKYTPPQVFKYLSIFILNIQSVTWFALIFKSDWTIKMKKRLNQICSSTFWNVTPQSTHTTSYLPLRSLLCLILFFLLFLYVNIKITTFMIVIESKVSESLSVKLWMKFVTTTLKQKELHNFKIINLL